MLKMSERSEKERRKKIAEALHKKTIEEFEARLPMSPELFKNLFDYLDMELDANSCDHTFRNTELFLAFDKVRDSNKVMEWLKENGAHCDCEVLAKIEEKFG